MIAVMDFKTVGDSSDLGEGAAEILRTTLMETRKFTVVERSMLKQVLKEQKLSLSGVTDQKAAVVVGKILRAKLVAVGSVVKMGESYTLNVRFIDVETGEVVSGKKLTTQSREKIPGLCGQMVKMLSKNGVPQEVEEELPQPVIRKPPAQGELGAGGTLPRRIT
jgi:TolB-like protein